MLTGPSRPTFFHKTAYGNIAGRRINDILKSSGEYSENKIRCMSRLWPNRASLMAFHEVFANNVFLDLESNPSILPFVPWWQEAGLINFVNFSNLTSSNERETFLTQIKEAIDRSPIRNVSGIIIELTGLCNLSCRHCFRGGSRPEEKELPFDLLKDSLIPFLRAGIGNFKITGGEPTLRTDKLLKILGFVKDYMYFKRYTLEDISVQIETGIEEMRKEMLANLYADEKDMHIGMAVLDLENPISKRLNLKEITPEAVFLFCEEWKRLFLEIKREAIKDGEAGVRVNTDSIVINTNGTYEDPIALSEEIKILGLVQGVDFEVSLDYPKDSVATDSNRGSCGVFNQARNFAETARSFGMGADYLPVGGIANIGNAADAHVENREVSFDDFDLQIKSELVDCGLGRDSFSLNRLRIRNGQVGFCQFAYALPEEFGDLTNYSMVEILNNKLITSRSMQIIAGGLRKFIPEINRSIFPGKFHPSCLPRNILLAYASWKEVFMEQGDSETAAIAKANRIVGIKYGYLPRETLLV